MMIPKVQHMGFETVCTRVKSWGSPEFNSLLTISTSALSQNVQLVFLVSAVNGYGEWVCLFFDFICFSGQGKYVVALVAGVFIYFNNVF